MLVWDFSRAGVRDLRWMYSLHMIQVYLNLKAAAREDRPSHLVHCTLQGFNHELSLSPIWVTGTCAPNLAQMRQCNGVCGPG